MKLENFKSGEYKNGEGYKAFLPSKINFNWGWDDTKLDSLLAEASRKLGELNAYSELIPNIDLYIKMHVKVEANKSSRIEGTKTTIEEDLLDYYDVSPEKRDDWQEVQNYVKATNYGIERVEGGFPVCNRLIREIHEILLTSVRGEYKTPGEFRKSQNWIGGTMPSNARYVPPLASDIDECLADLESFINNDDIDTPKLVKIAIIHYQFETIHPFLDGNGRVGRLLIPLYLQSQKMLLNHCFYISYYFEKYRDLYYDKLNNVRVNNDIIGWIKFFLEAVIEISIITKDKFKNVVNLTKLIDDEISKLNIKYENAKKVINYFYNEPVATRKDIVEELKMPSSTCNDVINSLVDANILVETTGYSRNQSFTFKRYIDLFLTE